MGDRFEWTNAGDDYHSVTESSGLNLWDSQLIRGIRSHNPETWWTKIDWAGTFSYNDMVAIWDFGGTIEIPVGVPEETVEGGSGADIVLGKTPPPGGTGFDVELKKEGGKWRSIATGENATEITTESLDEGTYAVRARLASTSDKKVMSDWSPKATFTVGPESGVGCSVVGVSNSATTRLGQWFMGLLALALVLRRRRL
jgi:MYXO-CTERM domain-containing protein